MVQIKAAMQKSFRTPGRAAYQYAGGWCSAEVTADVEDGASDEAVIRKLDQCYMWMATSIEMRIELTRQADAAELASNRVQQQAER